MSNGEFNDEINNALTSSCHPANMGTCRSYTLSQCGVDADTGQVTQGQGVAYKAKWGNRSEAGGAGRLLGENDI